MLARASTVINRTLVTPIVFVQPTSRCNSRCVSCDYWRSSGEGDLSVDHFADLARQLGPLGTRVVVFSGGEPLLRPELFDIAQAFERQGQQRQLLTSGVLLDRHVDAVAAHFNRVVISLDAATEAEYHVVRGIHALLVVERGVARLRQVAPELPVTARTTVHRLNYRSLPAIIAQARAMGLDQVSFLAADVSSLAFGRRHPLDATAVSRLALTAAEARELRDLVERTIVTHADAFATGFIAESPDRLRGLAQYYLAQVGEAPLPPVRCNAPWVSLVIDADGTVRPCFFHAPLGNIREEPLARLIEDRLPAFLRQLDVATDPTCQRCVCSLRTSWRSAPWS